MIQTRTTQYKEIKRKNTNRNGGYIQYWELIGKFNQQMKSDFAKTNFKYHQRIIIWFKIIIQFIFKPMLSVFHTVINYESKFTLINDELDQIQSFSKETTIYFLRIIPIWYCVSNQPKNKDYEIFK